MKITSITKEHLAIAEGNINNLVAPDGTMPKEWVLLMLAKVAAQGANRELAAVVRWLKSDALTQQAARDIEDGKHREEE